jgi:acetyl esterase/lipase
MNDELYLWPDGSPNNGSNDEYRPKIRVYQPAFWPPEGSPDGDRPASAAVLVCPGGGYRMQAAHEGQPFAQLFAMHGIVGVVLTYRVAPDRYPAAYSDAARAMRLLRSRAAEFGIDPARIAIMGFSAGGHLAATVATQPDLHHDPHDDLAQAVSARPDRVILGYPVISMLEHAHSGSREALIGTEVDPELADRLSGHLHVGPSSPPAFLFHTADDEAVPAMNSLLFAQACAGHGVPVELHIHAHGRHGVGMAQGDPKLRGWTGTMMSWLGDWWG